MTDLHPDPMAAPPAEADLRAALERARGGDRAALPALQAALDAHPEIWERYGDLAAHARRSWVELIAGSDPALAEALDRKAALGAELTGPSATPLEGLLVSRIVACWLQVHHADAAVAQAGAISIQQAELALKRQARAHKGYLMSIAALATIRRLLPAAPGVVAIPTTGHDPAAGPRESGPDGFEVVVPAAGDAGRAGGPAGPGSLALFDGPGTVPGRDEGPGGRRGGRGRSAS